MDLKGVIIEESLKDNSILKEIKIIKTKVEKVTAGHKTPWLSKWTIHTIQIPEEKMDEICSKLQVALDGTHEWYIELESNRWNINIFKEQIIKRRIYKTTKPSGDIE